MDLSKTGQAIMLTTVPCHFCIIFMSGIYPLPAMHSLKLYVMENWCFNFMYYFSFNWYLVFPGIDRKHPTDQKASVHKIAPFNVYYFQLLLTMKLVKYQEIYRKSFNHTAKLSTIAQITIQLLNILKIKSPRLNVDLTRLVNNNITKICLSKLFLDWFF